MKKDSYGLRANVVDEYARDRFRDLGEFRKELAEMEENSRWLRDYPSADLRLRPLLPMDALMKAGSYGWSEALAMETAEEGKGAQLYLETLDSGYLVRNCAKASLMETAKLYGTALSRMSPDAYAQTLNCGLDVANGKSMILLRYGKLAALHSDGPAGYEIMPIPDLLDITVRELENRFGEIRFLSGYNSHSYTEAEFELTDAQMYLVMLYQQALESVRSRSVYDIDFMPTVRFCSSDTSGACATLQPQFSVSRSRPVRLCDGIRVKHSRKGMAEGQSGMAMYRYEISRIYARFEEAAKNVKRMASVTLYHPENVVVGLCRKFGIPKRYGTAAYDEVQMYRGGEGSSMIAHDVFLAMSACIACAKERGASRTAVNGIDEAISRISQVDDWREFDVSGTVAWKD